MKLRKNLVKFYHGLPARLHVFETKITITKQHVKFFENLKKRTMDAIKELLQFLVLDARIDVKTVALQHVLGLTGSPEGLELLSDIPELVSSVMLIVKNRDIMITDIFEGLKFADLCSLKTVYPI